MCPSSLSSEALSGSLKTPCWCTGPSRGRPIVYPDRFFLKALLIMLVRRLHTVGELLAVLEELTPEMRSLRRLLSERGRFPSHRTFERILKALPKTLPEQPCWIALLAGRSTTDLYERLLEERAEEEQQGAPL